MIVLMAKYTIKPGNTETIIGYLREMGVKVRETEPACKAYRVHKPVDQDNTLLLYEAYEDEAALEFHRNTPHFKEIIEGKVVPLLERRDREVFDLVIEAI